MDGRASTGVEPELMQMSDAAEHLVVVLEQKRAAGNSLPHSAVQLTALLVRITGVTLLDMLRTFEQIL